MKVLLIGGTGFLGTEIQKILLAQDIDFQATSRSPNPEEHFVTCNILDKESLRAAMEGCSHVIHSAGLVSHSPSDSELLWKIHVEGTQNVFDMALELGIKRIVYMSTSGTIAVSDDSKAIPNEESASPFELLKDWPYYRTKYFAEEIALSFAKKGLEVISLNPSLLLGPNDPNGASTNSIQLFLDDKVPLAPCGGVGFVDVRDVAQISVKALSEGLSGERYLLNSSNMSFLEFYQRIARLADKPAPMMKMPNLTRKALAWFPKIKKIGLHLKKEDVELASYFWYVDSKKAMNSLNFKPRDSMDTLYDTVSSLQKKEEDFSWFSE
jgi:dihydroflavonol-4-reductase